MERTDELWGLAQRSARGFLRRFEDPLTRGQRDDLVQESAWTAWRWASSVRDPTRFEAAVRTIARRTRCRMLETEHRHQEGRTGLLQHSGSQPATLPVAGHCVSLIWLLGCLQKVLSELPELDRHLLLGLHEGFCCAELAARVHRSEQTVKVRIHRARRRVQMEIERAVLLADELDGVFDNPKEKGTDANSARDLVCVSLSVGPRDGADQGRPSRRQGWRQGRRSRHRPAGAGQGPAQ